MVRTIPNDCIVASIEACIGSQDLKCILVHYLIYVKKSTIGNSAEWITQRHKALLGTLDSGLFPTLSMSNERFASHSHPCSNPVFTCNDLSASYTISSFLLTLCALVSCVTALNQDQCLKDLNSGRLRSMTSDNRSLGLDNSGNLVENDANATAISYFDCVEFCPGGHGQEPFEWSMFTQQFAAWLLPWIALLSQLPFGAESKLDDFMSVVLTVGSPALTAYSLALTTLNGSYIASRLSRISFPNAEHAISVLSGLQQAPFRIANDELLASLLVLPQNDKWWETARSSFGHEHTWSISAFSGIAWVVIAYIFTIIDAFIYKSPTRKFISSDGPGVSSVWLWVSLLIPFHFVSD